MARKPNSLAARNRRLLRQNEALARKSDILEKTLHNSLGGLADGLTGFSGLGGQAPLTSLSPAFQNNQYQPVTLLWTMLMYLYKTHGLIQTAIDQPVLDALRGGLDLSSDQLDSDDIRKIEDYLEENDVMARIGDAFIWARLFGGGALIVNTEANSEEPIGDEIREGCQMEFYDACRWELTATRRLPENGRYGFYGKQLDASRVITILGKRAPFLIRAQLSDWGMSEVERMLEDFNMYMRGRNVVYEILEEAKVDVYQLKGFTAMLATSMGTNLTTKRIQTMNQIKNFNNALILDKEDGYEMKTLNFGGLPDILKENRIGIASALRMPMSKLFGTGSTNGLNSGEDDIENYNALIESEVRQPMKPVIRKVLKLVVENLFGEELDIRFRFRPLRLLGADAEEQIKTSKTNRFLSLYNNLLIDSKEIGEMLQKEELVPTQIKAEQGLLDEHPVAAEGQPVPVGPSEKVDGKAQPKKDDGKAEKADEPEKEAPEPESKPKKADKAEAPEKPEPVKKNTILK